MSGSYTYLGIHFAFSTKSRLPMIDDEIKDRLYEYIGGIIKSLDGIPMEINGMADHIHILCLISKEISVANFMRTVKSKSSKWIHTTFRTKRLFGWQDGYGAFTISKSLEKKAIKYIKDQMKHHKKKSFKEEFISLLEKFEIEYDEKYIWD